MKLAGPMAGRLDAIVQNWLVPAPDANPTMLEMMRLRDRRPPYQDPVPWAGEFVGKYLTSCVLAGRLTDDQRLRDVTARVMRELIATQSPEGYLGPFPDRRLLDRWDLWGHYHCMLAMFLWQQDTGDRASLDAATRAADLMCRTFLDTDKRVHDAGSHEMNMAVLHVLGLLYRQTAKPEYLRLMREIELDWQRPPAGDYHRLAAHGIEFHLTPKPRWESLHPMLGLAELYRITGEPSYRQALVHWWRSIHRTDVHNSGSFSTNEQAVGNPFQAGAIETCCTIAWMMLSVETLRLTGDVPVADALELATWNAVLGQQHPSGRWCTYDTPMNGKRLASAHSIVFQARPGTPELNCCSVNGPNGLGLISEWAVLHGPDGLYLNYYGAGETSVEPSTGARWSFVQTTDYPASGRVEIEVRPPSPSPSPSPLPLHLRIPAWSRQTAVAVNGVPLEPPTPGAYLKLDRVWTPGDRITLDLDLSPRALRGDYHVAFNTSLFRGPILLAFDQKYNTVEPAELPELDMDGLTFEPLPAHHPARHDRTLGPIVAVTAAAADGQQLVLCDFGSAGAYGTWYRSWLPVRNAPAAPFQLLFPEPAARLPQEELLLAWNQAEPGATYGLKIATDAQFQNVVVEQHDLAAPEFLWDGPHETGRPYFWQVTASRGSRSAAATNGPRSFMFDANAVTSLKGVVVRASLAGTPAPSDGRLLVSENVAPAAGRDGRDRGALAFDGASTKLVYDAPQFPLRTYTFSAWVRPRGLGADGRRWHQVVSAWSAPVNDPLRVAVQDQELVVSIEQPGGGARLSGGRVENDRWLHVAVVKRHTELTLFVNGQPVGRATVPPVFLPGPKNVGIGCNPNYSAPETFQGDLAEVLFVREALPDGEVRKLANPTAPD